MAQNLKEMSGVVVFKAGDFVAELTNSHLARIRSGVQTTPVDNDSRDLAMAHSIWVEKKLSKPDKFTREVVTGEEEEVPSKRKRLETLHGSSQKLNRLRMRSIAIPKREKGFLTIVYDKNSAAIVDQASSKVLYVKMEQLDTSKQESVKPPKTPSETLPSD